MKKIIFVMIALALITGMKAYAQDSNSSEGQSSADSTIQENAKDNNDQSSSSETAPEATNKDQVKQPVRQPVVQPVMSDENRLLAAIDANPKRGDLYNRLITFYYNEGKHKERLKIALKAIQNIGRTAGWCVIVGDENKFLGDFQNALISYQFALMLLPTDPGIYNSIGLTLLKMSNFNQAESAFKAAIFFVSSTDPVDKSIFFNNLGIAVESMHNLQDAYKDYQSAAKLYPSFTTAQDNVTRVKNLLSASGAPVN
jgi:tetratricopeptide (TPR) repeat protein